MKIEKQTVAILSMAELAAVVKLVGTTSENLRKSKGISEAEDVLLLKIHKGGNEYDKQND